MIGRCLLVAAFCALATISSAEELCNVLRSAERLRAGLRLEAERSAALSDLAEAMQDVEPEEDIREVYHILQGAADSYWEYFPALSESPLRALRAARPECFVPIAGRPVSEEAKTLKARPLSAESGKERKPGRLDEGGDLKVPISIGLALLMVLAFGAVVREILGRQRRRAKRYICQAPVDVVTRAGTRPGLLVNISIWGAQVQMEDNAPDARTRLKLVCPQFEVGGHVVWSNRRFMGIAFNQAIPERTVINLASGALRKGKRVS